jgi:hypothetical protein
MMATEELPDKPPIENMPPAEGDAPPTDEPEPAEAMSAEAADADDTVDDREQEGERASDLPEGATREDYAQQEGQQA